MENKAFIEEFKELVSLPVQSRDERRIADVVRTKLEAIGLTVEEDGAAEKLGGNTGNLIARLPGDPDVPTVLLSAHLDRVKNPGKITPVVDEAEGLIKSDGTSILAADDVSGLCTVLDALRRIQRDNIPHGPIEVVFSVCEEVGVRGSKELDFSKLSAKYAFVFDAPGRLGRIINQAPTKCSITVTAHGIKAHAGNEPEKGLSAIRAAAAGLMKIREGRISPVVTSNFGSFHAGAGTNVVCDKAEIFGEARGTDDAALEVYLEEVRQGFAAAAEEFKTTIDVDVKALYHTFFVDPSSEIVDIAMKALATVGVEGFCQRGGGGMDGNHFNWNGIQAIGLALGYSKNHTNAEQIFFEDMCKCGVVASELVREIYNRAKH